MHFLEATQFPKAPVLGGRKVNFTLGPAKSADFQVDHVPPTSQCLGKTQLCQLTVRLSASRLFWAQIALAVRFQGPKQARLSTQPFQWPRQCLFPASKS